MAGGETENIQVLISTSPSCWEATVCLTYRYRWKMSLFAELVLKKPGVMLGSALEIPEHRSGCSYVKTPRMDDYWLSWHLPRPQHKPWGQRHRGAAPLASPWLPPHLLPDSHAPFSVLPTVLHIRPYFWPFLLFTYSVFHFQFLYLYWLPILCLKFIPYHSRHDSESAGLQACSH